MPSTNPSPQVLREFVQNLLDDLKNGRVTSDEAIVASQQYPYLRTLVSEHGDEIAAALQDEEKLRGVLENMLGAAVVLVNKDLPQFQVEKSDQQLSPNDVVARARSFRAARTEVTAAMGQQQAKVGQLRKAFINRLVQNWVAQTRTSIDKEKQQPAADALTRELEQGVPDAASFEELSARVERALKNTRVAEGVSTAIQRDVAPVQRELSVVTQKLAGIAAIPKELVAHLSAPHPDRFATIAIQTISTSSAAPSAALARAASLARTAEAMSTVLPQEKDVTAVGVFFRAFASTPAQKAFAAVADALLNQLSPLTRQEVIKATFSRALEGVLARTDLLTERIGREFVESELFRLITDRARASLAQEVGPAAGAGRARGALEDVVGSLLRGPIVEPLVGSPREVILSYLELLAVEAKLPHDKKVLFPKHATAMNTLSLLSGGLPADVRSDVIRGAGFASSTALQVAASQLAQRLPSWQMFYIMMLTWGAPLTYTSFISPMVSSIDGVMGGFVPSSAFESVSGGSAGAISGGLGAVFGWVGRGLSGVAFGLSGGLIGTMFGGGLGGIFNRLRGPRAPDRFFDDTPKFMAVFIVVVIVLLFVFPSFLNSAFTGRAAKYAALLVRSQAYNTGGPYDEVFPEYNGPFPTQSAIASCPVSSGRITQGAYEGRTHGRTCAYDFASSFGSTVQVTHDGCVAAVRSDIPNNTFIAGSFGNYVRLAGTNPDGSHYYTTYAHLMTGSSLRVGQCISAGTAIGRVDATGFTFDAQGNLGGGTHLHYQYDGAGCVDLPVGCGGR